jgi:hypothetical protein
LSVQNAVDIDPIFGQDNTPIFCGSGLIVDKIKGSYFTCSSSGVADNMSALLTMGTIGRWTAKVKLAIYEKDSVGDVGDLVGVTEERFFSGSGLYPACGTWFTFDFDNPKPTVTNRDYYLVAWAWSTTCDVRLVRPTYQTSQKSINKDLTYGSFPDPMTGETTGNREFYIYCSYTEIFNITVTDEIPNNNSVIDFYFCNDSFYLGFNVTIYDGGWHNISVYFENQLVFNHNFTGNKTYYFNLYINYSKDCLIYDKIYNWSVTVKTDTDELTNSYSFDTGDVIYCSSLAFDENQFFFVIMLSLWCYLLYLATQKEPKYLYYLQSGIAMPLSIYCFGIAWFQGIAFGYMLGVVIILVMAYFLAVGFYK